MSNYIASYKEVVKDDKGIKVGSRVKLVPGHFDPRENNPVMGSRYACEGTVTRMARDRSLTISVKWDNHLTNTYRDHHLVSIAVGESGLENDPNLSFKIRKMTEQRSK